MASGRQARWRRNNPFARAVLPSTPGCAWMPAGLGISKNACIGYRGAVRRVGRLRHKYQEMGFTGGVAAQQITADTWRIQSRGNAYTASSTIQDFVLLKAGEKTQGS